MPTRTRHDLTRRAFMAAALAIPASAALARGRYRAIDVEVRVSPIVASRIVTDVPARVRSRITRGSARGGRAVRVSVELRTIDPYRSNQASSGRGIAARYTVRDAATGRVLASDRFIGRTRTIDDEAGSVAVFHVPRSRGAGERDLADEVASHVLRYGL